MERSHNLNKPKYKISKQVPQATSRRCINPTATAVRIKKSPRSRSRSPTRSSSLSRRSSSPARSSTLSSTSRTSRRSSSPARSNASSRRSSSPARSNASSIRSRTSRRSSSPARSNASSVRSRTSRRSSSPAHSNASSVRSPSTSRSSSPEPRKNSSVGSWHTSARPSSPAARNEKSTQSLSPGRNRFCKGRSSAISLTDTRCARSPNMFLLPEEEEAELSYDDSKDNNLELLFKNQIFALNAIVDNLNKDIGTHREILKTAKQINSEVKDLNKNINQLTDSISYRLSEERVHNRKIELLYLKKQLLAVQLATSYKEGA